MKIVVLNASGLVLTLNTHSDCCFLIRCHVCATVKVDVTSWYVITM